MMDYNNLPVINYAKTFNKKSEAIKLLIRQSLQIIEAMGVPIDDLSQRQREKTAMALLAVGGIASIKNWKNLKDSNDVYSLTTREIISFHNTHLEERISFGSYDDIRRQDLKRLLLAEIVIQSKPRANTSNPTRGYRLNAEYSRIIRNYGQPDWFTQVDTFNKSHKTYQERITPKRDIPKLTVKMLNGENIQLKDGEHNAIQKQIIESFLPLYGNEAVLLYFGDSDNKYGIVYEKEQLEKLGFDDLKQSKLPDVVAYSPAKKWIYLIEAYHTSNPITTERKYELEQMMGDGAKNCIFVTAFENISSYKNCPEDLAWETEVWIATDPEHMIHRNGSRFMGPYCEQE